MENLEKLSDVNLYALCKTYGARALEWRRKFIGLLPEVNRRRLYEKKGFDSIFVFAYKLAGLSEKQVRVALNLEDKFQATPILRELLIKGEVSVSKLARIASIAKVENQEFLANQVQILSKNAVETLVRDIKIESLDGLFEPKVEAKSLPGQTLHLSPVVHQKLLELQQKGFDINNLILEFLEKREQEIVEKKEQISKKVLQKEEEKVRKVAVIQEFSLELVEVQNHYVPQSVRKILREEFGTKCSVRSCQKPAKTIHHTQRFSLSRSHDPHYLAPLCSEHHELAHAVDVGYQEIKKKWVTK